MEAIIERRDDGTQLVVPAKVNHDHLNRLIEVLKNEEFAKEGLGFNMTTWWDSHKRWHDETGHHCGTVACVGGTIDALQLLDKGFTIKKLVELEISDMGFSGLMSEEGLPPTEEWLGLTCDEGDELFRPRMITWHAIELPAAVKVLENLRDYGVIDWRRAVDETKTQ